MLFTEHPLLERPAAAAAAGFGAVEFWWPWPDTPEPADHQIDGFVSAIRDAGVHLAGLNFFAGELTGPDCGVLSIPDRAHAFAANVDVALGIGAQLGTQGFNALYGNRVEDASPQHQDELGVEMLTAAAHAAGAIGATVLVEPISGPKPYPLRTAADVVAVLDRIDGDARGHVGFLCDLFHLRNNGEDLDTVIAAHADVVAHVQIADWPGRGEPGSGQIDLDRHLQSLQSAGYSGAVALEYAPTTSTEDSLSWLPRANRATNPT